jgi:hypothetical protein
VPTGVAAVRSERTSLASVTAPATFNCPAPCSKVLKPLSCCAVYIISALIMFGVSFGLICMSSAAEPATTGVAIEVPLSDIISESAAELTLLSSEGVRRTRRLLADSALTSLLPGATMSGLIWLS